MDITICEVGPRDGLQNEATVLSIEQRVRLCTDLASAGLRRIEAVSFVSAQRVPAMAHAEEVFSRLPRDGTRFSALVLNDRGFDCAVAAGVHEIRYALPVTDAYAQRNQGTTVAAGSDLARALARRCRAQGIGFGVVLTVAFGCPFEGPVGPEKVEAILEEIGRDAPDEVILADTIGVGVPTQVRDLLRRATRAGARILGCHFHDTRNTGVANAIAAVEAGVTVLDASVGGAGGCPFAPNATGNVATEDLVYTFEKMGIGTGIDLDRLIRIARDLGTSLGHQMAGTVSRAGGYP